MKKQLLIMMFAALMMVLTACGDSNSTAKNDGNNKEANQEVEASAPNNDEVEQPSSTTLPADFPDDFPFPDGITITEVRDDSDGSQKDFTIRFTFDPDIDFDSVSEIYESYRNKIGYEPVIEGEEFFAEGIYQFAAMAHSTPNEMFIITMQPTGETYGSIDLKYTE